MLRRPRPRGRAPPAPLYAVGVSLGGNALLKWLGERGGRGAASMLHRGGGRVGAGRPHGRRHRARPWLQPRLHLAFPAHAEAQEPRDAPSAFPACSTRRAFGARARCTSSTISSPRRCTASATPTTTGARASEAWLARIARADAGAQRAQRSLPAGGVAARRRRSRAPTCARVARRRRARRLRHRPVSRARPLAAAAVDRFFTPGADAHALARPGPTFATAADARPSPCPPEIFKAYDIRGIVGQHAHAADRATHRPALGSEARERGATRIVIGRDGRLSGPELAGALARRHPRRRRRRHRHRHGRHADARTSPRTSSAPVRRDGHRQPQSARLQRPEDDARRRHAVRRRHPGAARAHRAAAISRAAPAALPHADIARPTSSASSATCKLARPMTIAVDCGNGVAGAYRAASSTAGWAAR